MRGAEIECPGCARKLNVEQRHKVVPPPPSKTPPQSPKNPQPKVELDGVKPLGFWMVVSLLAAAFLAVFGGVYFGNRMAQKAPATWEYSFDFYTTPTFEQSRMDSADVELYDAVLNKDGNKGWEIVGFVPTHDGYHAVYKRPCAPVDNDEMQARFDRAEHDWQIALSKKRE